MSNETMPANDFQPGFRGKAQEYLNERHVQEFVNAASERMSATADYLRNSGATRMRSDVEKLIRSNPGPAILAAVTVGFLVGRALRRH
jgi:hypothetical protein